VRGRDLKAKPNLEISFAGVHVSHAILHSMRESLLPLTRC
jgi:hypothetical protein